MSESDVYEPDLAAIIADTAQAVFATFGVFDSEQTTTTAQSGEWLADGWARLNEAGFVQAMRSEQDGGVGVTAAMQIIQLSGTVALAFPLAEVMAADWLLARAGLPPAGAPTVFMPQPVQLSASGDQIHVRADVPWVPWARNCDIACVGMLDGSARLVLLTSSQFSVVPSENLAGEPRDTVIVDITLPVALFHPLSGIDHTTLHRMGALLRSIQLAGAASAAVQMTVDYASERAQFGKTLSRFQAVQQLLAVMAGEAAAAGMAAQLATRAWDRGLPFETVAIAKIRTGEAAGKIAAAAHQILGAIGFTREYALQLLTRRLWSWRDESGDEAAWSIEFGRALAQDGRPLWHAITDFSA